MHAMFYFIVVVAFFDKIKCYRSRGTLLTDNEVIENSMNSIMDPMKKLSGVFPNHDIELQFEIEQAQNHPTGPVRLANSQHQFKPDNSIYLNRRARTNVFRRLDFIDRRYRTFTPLTNKLERGALKYLPIHGLRRSNDLTIEETTTPATVLVTTPFSPSDPDKQIVYMKDFKNALENLEQKLLLRINDGKSCNQQEANNVLLPSKISLDNPKLMKILNSLKKDGPVQKDSKPSDEDLSWVKIKLPI